MLRRKGQRWQLRRFKPSPHDSIGAEGRDPPPSSLIFALLGRLRPRQEAVVLPDLVIRPKGLEIVPDFLEEGIFGRLFRRNVFPSLFECGQQFSSIDMDSVRGRAEMEQEGWEICYNTPFSFSWVGRGDEFLGRLGPECCNFHEWMRKIKRTFDPNTVSDPMNYVSPQSETVSK